VPVATARTQRIRAYNTGVEDRNNRFEGLNLLPPEEGFGLQRHENAERMGTEGWSSLYWAKRTGGGDNEIGAVSVRADNSACARDNTNVEYFGLQRRGFEMRGEGVCLEETSARRAVNG